MGPLSEELVDETCDEFAGFTDEAAYEETNKISKSQPELLAFIVELTEDLDQDVKELAIYMFFVIHRMFHKAYGKKIRKVTFDEIIECHDNNEKLMESLGGEHEEFFESIAQVQTSSQPYVFRYVVETLFEGVEGEEPVSLEEEDQGYLFLLMKTIIDVLTNKTS